MNSNENGSFSTFKTAPRVDLNRTLVMMPYPHDAVHRDIMINASHYSGAADTEILYFINCDANLECHLEFVVTASAAVRVILYEGPTVATAGTEINSFRLYRPSAKDIHTTINVGGTVTDSDYGTELKTLYNGGGGVGANLRGGSAVHEGAELVLKLDTVYCVRIIRDASGAVGAEFEWYEVPPYGGGQ